ncbi:SusC/RagA family TonB-linked outer membrane protein [Mucilaginibacter sp. RCC_168]
MRFFLQKCNTNAGLGTLMKLVVVLLCLLGGIQQAFAQQAISGSVKDLRGTPLVAASVRVKGTSTGTLTDKYGAFTIKLPAGKTVLTVTYVGYEAIEVDVASKTFSSAIVLKESSSLKEVVVVGYGTQRKIDVTGSIGSVNSRAITERSSPDAIGALQGQVPGVNITQNSGKTGDYRINIRGFNSINASNNPLFVIDGVIGADYSAINPNDIDKIDVLKDASASAIYGARGSGGVIIITTKQGNYNRPTTLSYNAVGGFNSLQREIPVLNSTQYQAMEKQAYANSGVPYPNFGVLEPDLFKPDNTPRYNTDWQKEVYKPTFSQNHNLSVSGGTDASKFNLAVGYQDDRPLSLFTYNKKFSARLNVDSKINQWLNAGLNISGIYNLSKTNDGFGYGVQRMALESLPYIPVKLPNGKWGSDGMHLLGESTPANPVADATNDLDLTHRTLTFANTYLEAVLSPNLSFKTSLSGQVNSSKNNFAYSSDLLDRGQYNGINASISTDQNLYWQSSSYFTYNNTFGRIHKINATLGAEWSQTSDETFADGVNGFDSSYFLFNNLGAANIANPPTSAAYKKQTNSYFGRVVYSLSDKYLFTATGRYDGASVFGENHKFAFFPSAAIAWRVSQEDFLKNSKLISNLKLRLSYGSTGNSSIDSYRSLSTLSTNYAIFSGTRTAGVVQGVIPNSDLKWEQTNQLDLGLDLDLFHGRINIVADVYNKVTHNLLLNAPVPLSTGYDNVLKNIGSVGNKGLELGITSNNLTGDLTWSTTLNLAFNKNKVLALGTNNEDIFPGPSVLDQIGILRVGQPVGSLWGYKQDGTWGSDEAAQAAKYGKRPGDIKVVDLNNDGQINSKDQTILGHSYPNYTGEFINRLKYKNFDFSLDIGFSQGNSVFNIGVLIQEQRQTYANAFTTVRNAWTPANQKTDVGYVRLNNDPHGSTLLQTSRYVYDGSFIRGRNMTLGYTFPQSIANKFSMSSLRVFAGLQNFFMLTKYKIGHDPEASSWAPSLPFAYGIDLYGEPRPRIFNLGLSMNIK